MNPTSVVRVGIAVICKDGRVVVGFRGHDPTYGALLEFPGGKVEPGETPEQCAERETREEASMRVRAQRVVHWANIERAGRQYELSFVACEPLTDLPPLPPFLWYPCARLDPDCFPPPNRPVVQLLRRCSQGGVPPEW